MKDVVIGLNKGDGMQATYAPKKMDLAGIYGNYQGKEIEGGNDEIIELTDLNIDVSKFEDLSEEEQVEYLRQMFKDNPDFLVNDNVKKSKGKTLVKEKHK